MLPIKHFNACWAASVQLLKRNQRILLLELVQLG